LEKTLRGVEGNEHLGDDVDHGVLGGGARGADLHIVDNFETGKEGKTVERAENGVTLGAGGHLLARNVIQQDLYNFFIG